ncbi:hypothetical protein SAMN04488238_12123 [Roseicitreum antarcticum]|uniref:Uncharacterized protein n=1 Tax=Roseicitreum antarcticum TaxID=564137 RepID=A0A1H3EJF8_9RHOB|nr:hypothetical protein SAMN04488238_12123 [Roseicitreum antarcticum]
MECKLENHVFSAIFRLSPITHLAAAALAFGGFQWVKGRLDTSYAASGHPVDYATGQLAFDARLIEGYYAHMIEAGTLQVYWQTQFIDFGFIAAVMIVAVLFGTLAARFGGRINRLGVWGWNLGLAAAFLGVSGAAFDALENLLSFMMLASSHTIPQPLALAYSTAAAVKFALLTTAMFSLLLSLMAGAAGKIQSAVSRARR